jgi:hypothetical protein
MKHFVLFFLLSLIAINTQAQDHAAILGTGGGITGAVTAFKITSRGEVFKGKGLVDIQYTECAGMKKSSARQFIRKIDAMTKSSGDFNHPGNIYYFMGRAEDSSLRITWGHPDHTVPPDVQQTYSEILAAVSNLHYKPLKKQDKKPL